MKKMNKSNKLKIISRIICNLDLLKDQINGPNTPAELMNWEIKTIVDVLDDISKFEQLAERPLYEKIKNNYPDNEVIQQNIESLLI